MTAIPSELPAGGGGTGNVGSGSSGEGNDGGVGGSDDGGAAGSGGEDLAGTGGQPQGPPPWEAPTLYQCSFASYSLPGQYIRHRNALGWVTSVDPVTEDAFDATFEVIEGMIDEGCFSIRLLPEPDQEQRRDFNFMRHANSRVRFNLADDTPLFLGDATFCFEPGLAEPTWVSLRSYNYENQYVRMVHNETNNTNELWIDQDDGSPEFAADATFRIENPFEQP